MTTLTFDVDTKQFKTTIDGMIARMPKELNKITGDVARIYEESIQSMAKTVFKYETPELRKTIKAENIKRGRNPVWVIKMAKKTKWVERGRPPGKMPPETEAIKRWASRAGMSTWWLRKTIGRHGTEERPFIIPGIHKANRSRELQDILNRGAQRIVKGR